MSRSGTTNQDKGAGCLLLLLLVVLLAIGNNFGVHIALAWAVFFMALYVGWRMWREGTPFSFSTPKAKDLHAELQSVGAMSGAQFEVFMAKIFRAIGCNATVLGGSGDQGVDLIVAASDGKAAVHSEQIQVAAASQVNTGDANAAADDGSAEASISQDLSIDQSAVQNTVVGDDNFVFGNTGTWVFWF